MKNQSEISNPFKVKKLNKVACVFFKYLRYVLAKFYYTELRSYYLSKAFERRLFAYYRKYTVRIF